MNALAIRRIEQIIHLIRGQRVILDRELAQVYGTSTTRLNEQVRRNLDRFPDDFSFLLTRQEVEDLTSQYATSSWGGRRTLPRAFTEHGAVMVASVLRTSAAIRASILVVRAFVRMRRLILENRGLARRLREMEGKVGRHDRELRSIIVAVRQLLELSSTRTQRIGFHRSE